VDTFDSYYCACNPGYTSASTSASNCNTDPYCRMTPDAGLQCFCTIASCNVVPINSSACQDINECAVNQGVNQAGCMGNCTNTVGSYFCTCGQGLTLYSNLRSCEDINECLNPRQCDVGRTCVNGYGTYACIVNGLFGSGSSNVSPEKLMAADSTIVSGGSGGGSGGSITSDNATLPLAIVLGLVVGAMVIGGLAYMVARQRDDDESASTGSAPSRMDGSESSIGFQSINSKFAHRLGRADGTMRVK